MEESLEDARLRQELIESIMHSISIINSNLEERRKDDEEL
jgi:hypothetical protein